SFEFSAGGQRLVVNCGASPVIQEKWDGALRATAAHSTVTLADTTMANVLSPGLARDLIGPRMSGGPTKVETFRQETLQGWSVDASHDGYLTGFGIVHERRITLGPRGEQLTGSDRLVPKARSRRGDVPFAVRFHIHPDVRMSPSQGGDILLKLPNGDGWRFRAGGGSVALEESVYLGGDAIRRTEQLVISGAVRNEPVEIAWLFEHIGA
ncbi:MAG: heparinase II/III family protein, partial [Rhizomicrobium sp.]